MRRWWLDACCIASVVGVWPRFIEPRLVTTNVLTLKFKGLPAELAGLKILHFSDLHFNAEIPSAFLDKLCQKAKKLAPDLVAFTGDFLCHSHLRDGERLKRFLCSFPQGKYGNYAIFGNHDYAETVSTNERGEYAVYKAGRHSLRAGFKRLLKRVTRPTAIHLEVKSIPLHADLVKLLSTTPFKLLHNQCHTIAIGQQALNICGLGEYLLGRADTKAAFDAWDSRYPGIILTHNPDSIPLLSDCPGNLVLCGHTHGGQVNLPGFYNTFMMSEHPQWRRGMVRVHDKWVYISRGVGGTIPFRCFAPPELLCITLQPQ